MTKGLGSLILQPASRWKDLLRAEQGPPLPQQLCCSSLAHLVIPHGVGSPGHFPSIPGCHSWVPLLGLNSPHITPFHPPCNLAKGGRGSDARHPPGEGAVCVWLWQGDGGGRKKSLPGVICPHCQAAQPRGAPSVLSLGGNQPPTWGLGRGRLQALDPDPLLAPMGGGRDPPQACPPGPAPLPTPRHHPGASLPRACPLPCRFSFYELKTIKTQQT